MRDTICANGGVVCYKLYDGEGHGWRLEETIKDALQRELHFYECKLLKGSMQAAVAAE